MEEMIPNQVLDIIYTDQVKVGWSKRTWEDINMPPTNPVITYQASD